MDRVSMNDGLDGRETVAFGLAAGEVAVLVLSVMTGYATLRSSLPGAAAWCLAALLVMGGAILAWGRLAGRSLLEWLLLLVSFTVRTRHARVARLRQRCRQLRRASRRREYGCVQVRLALREHADRQGGVSAGAASSAPRLSIVADRQSPHGVPRAATPDPTAPAASTRVVAFFSLCGGTGRTTLAVEVAALLAVRRQAAAASGSPASRVALVDLTERSPAVALRLGIPPPLTPAVDAAPVVHETGLLVYAGVAPDPERSRGSAERVTTILEAAHRAGAGVVVVDVDCDLGPCCMEVLRHCDAVHITVTATAGGVIDAYRSTALLRRLGLRDRIGYVATRWRDGVDLGEVMADLGGSIAAAVPDEPGFVEAESRHHLVGLSGGGPASTSLARLADAVEAGGRDRRAASAP